LEQGGKNSGEVVLTCTADDVICELDPPSVMIGQTGTSELRIITNDKTSLGQKPISILAIGGGDEATASFRIDVEETPKDPPTSRISSIPPAGVNKPVFFNGTNSSDENGEIIKYHWDFGNRKTGQGSQIWHTYEESGPYTVLLTVTDDDGETHQSERAIIVSPAFDPVVIILLGIIVLVAVLAGLVIITRKRGERGPKKLNIPKPKESKLK
jgi:hypothetical protein